MKKKEKKQDWSKELKRLDEYFMNATLPKGRFEINEWTTTHNLAYTLDSYMQICEANMNNPNFKSFLLAMQEIEKQLRSLEK